LDLNHLRALLLQVSSGAVPVEDALSELRHLPYRDLGMARVDHHRALRQGVPEVIFGERKTPEQIVAIAREMQRAKSNVMVTRVDDAKGVALAALMPELALHAPSRIASLEATKPTPREGKVCVVTAGTADIPVAEECAETLRLIGITAERIYDCGVAGLHRLLDQRETLSTARVVIAIAGMEGALPSVMGGLVAAPIIAVPTSVGYGAHFGGITPLLTMLTTCASGVTVVNIDNGFGAAMAAHRILGHGG
jgi:NCAIR mutase (PurE)-related protein